MFYATKIHIILLRAQKKRMKSSACGKIFFLIVFYCYNLTPIEVLMNQSFRKPVVLL